METRGGVPRLRGRGLFEISIVPLRKLPHERTDVKLLTIQQEINGTVDPRGDHRLHRRPLIAVSAELRPAARLSLERLWKLDGFWRRIIGTSPYSPSCSTS